MIRLRYMLVLLASCGSESPDPQCMDCGPCGIVGGPNNADGIVIAEVGTDAAGTPTIELGLWRQGECAGENGETHWLRWEGGSISLEQRTAHGGLDTSSVTFDGTTYVWSARDVQLTHDDAGAEVWFHFTQAAVASEVRCAVDTGTISCALE